MDATHAELLIEKRRTLPDEDVRGSFIVLTMGIVVEALQIAAAHEGAAIEVTLRHDLAWYGAANLRAQPDVLLPFAELALRPALDARPELPLALFAMRRTSRLPYSPEPVSAAACAQLAVVATAGGQRYAQTHDRDIIEQLLALNTEAVFADLNHAPYRNEMGGWLRYSEAHAQRTRDGLDTRCMNVAPLELWAAFHASPMLRWPGLGAWFRKRYRDQIGPVATMGFLCGRFWDPADAYPAGRALMRFWLECTRLGLSLHPYGNLVTHRPVAERAEAAAGLSDVWLAFKIGRSPEAPASRRRTLEETLA